MCPVLVRCARVLCVWRGWLCSTDSSRLLLWTFFVYVRAPIDVGAFKSSTDSTILLFSRDQIFYMTSDWKGNIKSSRIYYFRGFSSDQLPWLYHFILYEYSASLVSEIYIDRHKNCFISEGKLPEPSHRVNFYRPKRYGPKHRGK